MSKPWNPRNALIGKQGKQRWPLSSISTSASWRFSTRNSSKAGQSAPGHAESTEDIKAEIESLKAARRTASEAAARTIPRTIALAKRFPAPLLKDCESDLATLSSWKTGEDPRAGLPGGAFHPREGRPVQPPSDPRPRYPRQPRSRSPLPRPRGRLLHSQRRKRRHRPTRHRWLGLDRTTRHRRRKSQKSSTPSTRSAPRPWSPSPWKSTDTQVQRSTSDRAC